jgi:hypothetical protein
MDIFNEINNKHFGENKKILGETLAIRDSKFIQES